MTDNNEQWAAYMKGRALKAGRRFLIVFGAINIVWAPLLISIEGTDRMICSYSRFASLISPIKENCIRSSSEVPENGG